MSGYRSHAEQSAAAHNATPCTAASMTFGGRCLACGWDPSQPVFECGQVYASRPFTTDAALLTCTLPAGHHGPHDTTRPVRRPAWVRRAMGETADRLPVKVYR